MYNFTTINKANSFLFAIIFGSTLLFYLRWSSQWYREHVDIEFSNQFFSRDMLLAS